MRLVPIALLNGDEKLGYDIFDIKNRLLLKKGTVITQTCRRRLLENGYASVSVMENNLEDPSSTILPLGQLNRFARDLQAAFTDFKTLMTLRQEYLTPTIRQKLKKQLKLRDVHVDRIVTMADEVIQALQVQKSMKLNFIYPKTLHEYTYHHAVFSGILSVMLGMHLKRNLNELKALFIAAVFCEMGNLAIPEAIIMKKDALTDQEFEIVKSHCRECYHEVNSCSDLNYIIKLICLEHHEKLDGSGYPNGLKGDEINFLAKILTVADAYDALVSDRVYRHAHSFHDALEILESKRHIHYDATILDALAFLVEPYPLGTLVTLNDKLTSMVVDHTSEKRRPVVKVMNPTSDKSKINLKHHPELRITGTKYHFKPMAETSSN